MLEAIQSGDRRLYHLSLGLNRLNRRIIHLLTRIQLYSLINQRHKFRLKAPYHLSLALFRQLKEQVDQSVSFDAVVVAEVASLLRTRLINDIFIAHERPDLSNHLLVNFGHSAPMTGDILIVL